MVMSLLIDAMQDATCQLLGALLSMTAQRERGLDTARPARQLLLLRAPAYRVNNEAIFILISACELRKSTAAYYRFVTRPLLQVEPI
jgi:hypothetical protein